MARTITEIHTEILNNLLGDVNLANLTSTSQVAIYRLFAYIIAVAIHTHELLFDLHANEVDTQILNQKNARLPWYRYMALKFQYGFDLIADTDNFDNENATDAQIEASKIIKYAAVNESEVDSRVILKIAGETNEELAPIELDQRSAFDAYIAEVKPAGVKITIINYEPDILYLSLRIFRDPLVLSNTGMSIKNGNYPVEDAINEYMKELPFDGEFIVQNFVDKLQKVDGVKIAHIINIESSWIDPELNDYGDPVPVDVKTIPESGYFKVDNFNNIEYVV
ncbi:nucleotidyltransferase [Formosa sp. A9]|uniref:nucleotidyltransferase n=1 Tax=Formosa sp. A9 TaxID=3442641 RepID=UPI003EB7475F